MSVISSRRRACAAAGFALLEALVAVVIASVGFIGAARLQTVGLKLNASSGLRQKAVVLTYQMTDRMRANLAGVALGAYNNPATGSKACLTSGCTSAQLAVADMTEWSDDIASQLPAGSGMVCVDSTPDDGTALVPACDGLGNVLAVKVWWTDSLGTSRFTTMVRP